MNFNLRLFTTFLFLSLSVLSAEAQRKIASYEKYIKEYSNIAVSHQNKYGIPASITLAQGILESGAGQSSLARKSNNHFGIKCHSDWNGGRVYHDDDLRGECFRQYRNVSDSYEDHARFLADRPRYAPLFGLNIKDYKGWARGLQRLGYATDKAYANKLIKIIEDYELYKYDSGKTSSRAAARTTRQPSVKSQSQPIVITRTVYKTFGLLYVYAKENDNFESIANDTGFKVSDLLKYNEAPEDFPLQANDVIYLQKKKSKADKPHYDHVVQIGESMHSIAQRYGIQIKALYKMNKKKDDYVPEEGDVLRLR